MNEDIFSVFRNSIHIYNPSATPVSFLQSAWIGITYSANIWDRCSDRCFSDGWIKHYILLQSDERSVCVCCVCVHAYVCVCVC